MIYCRQMKIKYGVHNPLFLNKIARSFKKLKFHFSPERQIKYRKKQDSRTALDADSIKDDIC
jgi:hypothetical protein